MFSSSTFTITTACVVTATSDLLSNSEIDIQQNGSLTINFSGGSLFTQDGGSITVRGDNSVPDGVFTVNGDFAMGNNFNDDPTLTVEEGGQVSVTGDMTLGSMGAPAGRTTTLSLEGTVTVGNDLNTGNESILAGTAGTLNVTNDVTDGGTDDGGFTGTVSCGGTCSTLPVELVSFVGQMGSQSIDLYWSTYSELNNEGFEIQKSMDGLSFETIGFVTGNGTTNVKQDYTFADYENISSGAYYRLRQVDFDGTFAFSRVIHIKPGLEIPQILMYPSTVYDRVTLSGAPGTSFRLVLQDLSGKRHLTIDTPVYLEELENEVNRVIPILPSTLYIVTFISNNERRSLKFIKK